MAPIRYGTKRKFRRFPLLPPEVRRRIWYFCLPTRIVEFDVHDHRIYDETGPSPFPRFCSPPSQVGGLLLSDAESSNEATSNASSPGMSDGTVPLPQCFFPPERFLHEKPICNHVLKVAANRSPPVIMYVCRESYNVALSHGSTDRTGKLPTWLQPSVDRMLFFHTTCRIDLWMHDEGPREKYMSKVGEISAICDLSKRLDLPLAFYHLDLYPFRVEPSLGLEGWEDNYVEPQIACLNKVVNHYRHDSFQCAITTVVFHLTREEAASSGLFGRLGEDLCQLVDVYDSEKIRRYYELWKPVTHQEREHLTGMNRAWDFLLASDSLHAEVSEWLANLQYIFLAAVWEAARTTTHQHDDTIGDVFQPRLGPCFPRIRESNVLATHPFVIQTRAWLPTVFPCISFRVCTRDRCLSQAKESNMRFRKRWRRWGPNPTRVPVLSSASSRRWARKCKKRKHWPWSRRPYLQKAERIPLAIALRKDTARKVHR